MKKNIFNKIIIVTLGIFILSGVGYLILNPKLVEAQLNAMKLLPQEETFTEVYFSDHQKLPQKVDPYQLIPVEFTIHNLEGKEYKYGYEVLINTDGNKVPLTQATVSLEDNEYKTIKESYSTAYSGKRYQIIVNLINKNQSIDFWVNQ